jgi:23S rRNA U2552 (ribose-2'-O)-methylase RlmE/FtsJ
MIVHNISQLTNKNILSSINLITEIKTAPVYISHSLYHYLTKSKNMIDNNVSDWDYYKKYTNPYEFIHTQIVNTNDSVSQYKAVSRSFYKLIELVNFFNILEKYEYTNISSFHLAEGPGGFIEAMFYLRKNKSDKYYGMTLKSNDKTVPKWNKLQNKFRFNTNIVYENGSSQNGDLLNPENFKYCNEKYHNSMELITGDGGFDFSVNYEQQENTSTKLILAQVFYAIIMQKNGGHFTLKIFDIFRKSTIEIIYLLNYFYSSVTISKPNTSRFANSEKYIVCKNFKLYDSSEYFNKFYDILNKLYEKPNDCIHSLLKFTIPLKFINEIEEINCILGKKQLATINTTLHLIQEKKQDKINKYKKINIDKCIFWCQKHKIPYNTQNKPVNIFTSKIISK